MHYLIDGHNLIGKLPDIKLSDSDDEIRLILRLKGWVAGHEQRQVTVVFDGGITGGISHRLSTKAITVVFAPQGKTADDLLIQRLQRLRNPRNVTLVSSDRRIIDAAKIARIKHLKSEEFITRLGFVFREETKLPAPVSSAKASPSTEKAEDPQISAAEVDEWLNLFGPPPKVDSKRKRGSYSVLRKQEEAIPEVEPQPEARHRLTPEEFAAMAESDDPELDEAEVAEWLALFSTALFSAAPPGDAQSARKQTAAQEPAATPKSRSVRTKEGKKGDGRLTTMKSAPRSLSQEEVEDWLQLFGGEKG